jgi:hypothetical protein
MELFPNFLSQRHKAHKGHRVKNKYFIFLCVLRVLCASVRNIGSTG